MWQGFISQFQSPEIYYYIITELCLLFDFSFFFHCIFIYLFFLPFLPFFCYCCLYSCYVMCNKSIFMLFSLFQLFLLFYSLSPIHFWFFFSLAILKLMFRNENSTKAMIRSSFMGDKIYRNCRSVLKGRKLLFWRERMFGFYCLFSVVLRMRN